LRDEVGGLVTIPLCTRGRSVGHPTTQIGTQVHLHGYREAPCSRRNGIAVTRQLLQENVIALHVHEPRPSDPYSLPNDSMIILAEPSVAMTNGGCRELGHAMRAACIRGGGRRAGSSKHAAGRPGLCRHAACGRVLM
jgi:hypothetical protein